MWRRIKQKIQWCIVAVLVMVFSGSFLLRKKQELSVYYVKTTARTTAASVSLAPLRHATKSLAELGQMDEINRHVLFLNQIPNCGAEVLIFLLQKLQGFNNYRHVRLKGPARLDRIQQEVFVDGFFNILRQEAVPVSSDRQMNFVNFTSFDKQSPTFINLIREPADKVLSRSIYNNKQYGQSEFAECLSQGKRKCTGLKIHGHDLIIPYFCGHEAKCVSDKQWALQVAKNNVEKYYPVVGVLEELNATLEVLEHHIPYFFKGVQKLYQTKVIDKFNAQLRTNSPRKTTMDLRRILHEEYEFYDWIKSRLFQQLQLLYGNH